MVPMMVNQEVHCLELHLRESLLDPSEYSLMVPMMDHYGLSCLELHLRSPVVGLTRGDFLRSEAVS